MWGKYEQNERGVSNLVGVILLVAISITGALLILSAGQITIQDTQDEQNVEVASDTFKQADSMFRSVPRNESNAGSRSVSIPESVQGQVQTTNESTYRIRLNGNSTCDSGVRPLGSMQYEDDNEKLVGYEGGGVWESTEAGAVMESPPALSYEEGGLNVRFTRISGNVTDSDEITATINESGERALNNELSLLLYTNLTTSNIDSESDYSLACPPGEVENATVFVNDSAFAGAWARYAQESFDDRRVDVEPSGSADPGDDVKITFKLGDVSPTEFSVSNLTTERHGTSEPLWVNGTIQNEGGLNGSQTVEFDLTPGSGSPVVWDRTKTVSVDGGESKRVSFEVPSGELGPGSISGPHDATIATDNDSDSVSLDFHSSRDHVTDFDVTTSSSPSEGAVGEDLTVEVDVTNDGGLTGTRAVTYNFNGTARNTTTVTLNPGQTKTLTYTLPTTDDGSYDWNVTTDESFTNGTVLVGTEPTFTIENIDPPSNAPAGNEFWLNATINNTGQLNGSGEVTLMIRNDTLGYNVTKDPSVTVNGTIADSGDVATVNVSGGTIPMEGTYEYVIDTGDVVQTGGFSVDPNPEPNLIVSSLSFSQDPVLKGNDVTIEAEIQNTGQARGDQRVDFEADGSGIGVRNVNLSAGSSTSVSVTRQVEAGTFTLGQDNRINVSTENGSVVQYLDVRKEESISETDDGQIIANERLDVSVQLLGAELEGRQKEWCDPYYDSCLGSFPVGSGHQRYGIINDPVEMSLVINGETEHNLWGSLPGGGDVNHPEAEQELLSGGNPYNQTTTLEAGDRALVTATSFTCDYYQYTDVRFPDIVAAGETMQDGVGKECGSRSGTRLSIDGEGEDPRVVIRKDGESIRGGEDFQPQADDYQRNVKQMLQGRLNDTGYLDLAPGERVLIYELSDEDATIEDASEAGDPDYNDAVVLFKVLSKNRTIAPPPSYEITDVDAPASVQEGDTETMTATINNTGGQAGETDVTLRFGGYSVETEPTGDLDPGEETEVDFDVPTARTGTFDYTVSVTSDRNETRSGQLTVGSPPTAYFQVSEFTANETAVERGETVEVEATIDNVGSKSDTQTVKLRNVTDGNDTAIETKSGVSLSAGNSTTLSFDLPTHTNGTLAYNVTTEDDGTSAQYVYVDESHVAINETEAGLTTYNESELIERKSAPHLTAKLNNHGGLGGERTVNLTVTNQSSGETEFETKTVTVGDGKISPPYPGYATFDTTAVNVSEGYYNYKVTVEDSSGTVEDSWTGELFVHNDATVEQSADSDSPIVVDSGQVEVGT